MARKDKLGFGECKEENINDFMNIYTVSFLDIVNYNDKYFEYR